MGGKPRPPRKPPPLARVLASIVVRLDRLELAQLASQAEIKRLCLGVGTLVAVVRTLHGYPPPDESRKPGEPE